MRKKRKVIIALGLVLISVMLYALFLYFSWDIMRLMIPNNSVKLVEKSERNWKNMADKLPPVDMATASPKVMIIVVDSLSYNLLDMGFKLDILPNLKKVFASSQVGMLLPSEPIETPPILTSMATGVVPEMHGILGFVREDGQPYSGASRAYHAFWRIAAQRGYKVAVVGWPFTWPVTETDGYFLAAPGLAYMNYEVYRLFDKEHLRKLLYDPATDEMAKAISHARKRAQLTGFSKVEDANPLKLVRFFPFKLNPVTSAKSALKLDIMNDVIQRDKFFLEMAKYIIKTDKSVDVLATYGESPDTAGHLYFFEPEKILKVYAWIDFELGELMKLVEGQPVMIVTGDHGMMTLPLMDSLPTVMDCFKEYKECNPLFGEHDPIGAIAIRAPVHTSGQRIISVTPEEIAPFVLSAFGIPPSMEMSSLGLAEWYLGRKVEPGDYSSKRDVPKDPLIRDILKDPKIVEKYKEWLESLGYLQ